MAIAFDAFVESLRTGVTDPHTWTHTPVGTPRAVVVTIINRASNTDWVVGITYGGVALTRVTRATDSVSEAGAADLWFLGSGIPTGAQTVSADLSSATTEDLDFCSITFTAALDTKVVASAAVNDDQTNPQATLPYASRLCQAVCALFGGANTVASYTSLASQTRLVGTAFGTTCALVDRQTSPGTANFTIGYTAALEDAAFVAAAVSEVVLGGIFNPLFSNQFPLLRR